MKIRIAVVINDEGHWSSCGFGCGAREQDDTLIGAARRGLSEAGRAEREYIVEVNITAPPPNKTIFGIAKEVK